MARTNNARRLIPSVVALAIIGALFLLSRQPVLSDQEEEELASRFSFEKLPLPELSGYRHKMVREVHSSLRHISAWISFVGAAVALTDLDMDGLPNDLIQVDPRTDQIVVAPVPGTGSRYEPFALDARPLEFSAATMAPMGCRAGDFNEDGLTDILAYYWGRSPILFLRRSDASTDALAPDTFVARELVEPHERWFTSAVTQADLDGDGHIDLVVGNYSPDGGRVLDAAAGGTEPMMHSASRAFNGGRNRLFLWEATSSGRDGSFRFREAENVLEDQVARGWTLAVGAADLDGDLLPEIYFAHDFGPDRLLHNRSRPGQLQFAVLNGDRRFTTPRSKVLGGDAFNGMGIDFGDLNGDGILDMFVSNIDCPFAFAESHFLFLSTGRIEKMRHGIAPYRDASQELGLARCGWGWEARLADFDNDGVLEAMQATGFLKGTVNRWPEIQELALVNDELVANPRLWHQFQPGDDIAGSQRNPFFVRAGDGRYYDIAEQLKLTDPGLSRGIATADVDGDGRLDFAVAHQWEPSFFHRNTAPNAGRFLGLHLRLPVGRRQPLAPAARSGHPEATQPSRPAIGAAATVHLPDGRRLVAQVDGGNGHSGQRSFDLHFGLDNVEPSTQLRVDIRWRDTNAGVRSSTFHLRPGWHTLLLPIVAGVRSGTAP